LFHDYIENQLVVWGDEAYDYLTVRDILAVIGVKNWGGCKKVGKFIGMIG
jgi:hypothetical protein